MIQGHLSPDQSFADAADIWLESRNFADGKVRARYISPGTIISYAEYLKPLKRHFGALRLDQIHVGTIREYQLQRATGQLGSPYEEVFARVCKWMRVRVADTEDNALLRELIDERVKKISYSEVGPNKVNQELGLLVRILKRAGAWSAELEQFYEPLQREENDIPKALTPSEQQLWLETSASKSEWELVHLYSVVAFRTTCSNVEMRSLRLGDVNLHAKTISIQAATAKNKYRIRSIGLAPDAQWAMQKLVMRAADNGSIHPQHHVFPFFDPHAREYVPEKAMSNSGMKRAWSEVREATGLSEFSPHDCRHTAITRFAEAGTPVSVIMSMAGHISPKMVKHYTQISAAAQQWAIQAVYNGTMYPAQVKQPVQNVSKIQQRRAEQKYL